MTTFRQALQVQGRVLYALILREALGKYGKSKMGYLWALIEPVAQVLILILIFTALGRKSPVGGDLAVFFATGILPWLLYSHLANRLSGALGANQALLTYPHVTPTNVLFGRALLEAATMMTVFILIIALLRLTDRALAIYDLFNVVTALMVLTVFATGIGMINSTLRLYFDSWDKIFSAVNRPLYFVSGVFFTAAALPHSIRDWLQWNPVFQYIDWLRAGFFSSYEQTYIHYEYALICAALSFFLGLLGSRLTRHRARQL